MKKFVVSLLFIGYSFFGIASTCSGPNYYLTEVLANEELKHHIFTCEILSSNLGYTKAIVRDVYRGVPSDTVEIYTGDGSMTGRDIVIAGERWLIISEIGANQKYHTTGCYNLSRRLENRTEACALKDTIKGKRSIDIINQYFELVGNKFSGNINLSTQGNVYAEARFKDGLAHGTWTHFRYNWEMDRLRTFAEMDYKLGKIEGKTYKYLLDEYTKILDYESCTKDGLLQYEIYSQRSFMVYTYPESTTKLVEYTSLNESGDTVKTYTTKYIDFERGKSNWIHYKEGYYFNMRDSTSFSPLAEGEYVSGKKVGVWKYFNKLGKIVDVEEYDYPEINASKTIIYGSRTGPGYKGVLKNGRRVGIWRQYYNSQLDIEFYYNVDSELEWSVNYYNNGSRLHTPYRNDKRHGLEQEIDSQGVVRKHCEYKNGSKNGTYIEYDKEGNIIQESIYKNGRETTVYTTSTNAPKVNGFSHGYNIQMFYGTDQKLYEGEMNMGRNVGKHIRYRKDSSIESISYYPTMQEVEERKNIADPCEQYFTIKREYYDEKGTLIRSGDVGF